jgi:hypothetical protein
MTQAGTVLGFDDSMPLRGLLKALLYESGDSLAYAGTQGMRVFLSGDDGTLSKNWKMPLKCINRVSACLICVDMACTSLNSSLYRLFP